MGERDAKVILDIDELVSGVGQDTPTLVERTESPVPTESTASISVALGERFELEAVLGEGSMGIVYRALDTVLERPVAVKLIHEKEAKDPVFRSRFFIEAKIVAGLAPNPHVVTIYDIGETEAGQPYIVMEYLPGRTAKAILRDVGQTSLPAGWVLTVAKQMLIAVADAHAHGIVHRDLKPENVFVLRSHSAKVTGGRLRNLPFLVKVLDFGIARSNVWQLPSALRTAPGFVVGTPRYMSPEQAAGDRVTVASDVYSLGLVIYEMAAGGTFPISATSSTAYMSAHIHQTPKPLAEILKEKGLKYPKTFTNIVDQMLAKMPNQRPKASRALEVILEASDRL